LNQFKEHINLKADIKAWKKLTQTEKTWKRIKSLFTKAINENKSDTGTLKATEIANAVKEQVNKNKES
jgi:ribonucleotide reductase beta subunit family protein with ferritin-like domain